jgi:hypothetical protein
MLLGTRYTANREDIRAQCLQPLANSIGPILAECGVYSGTKGMCSIADKLLDQQQSGQSSRNFVLTAISNLPSN